MAGGMSRSVIALAWYTSILNADNVDTRNWMRDTSNLMTALLVSRAPNRTLDTIVERVLTADLEQNERRLNSGVSSFLPPVEKSGVRWPFASPLGLALIMQRLASVRWLQEAAFNDIDAESFADVIILGVNEPISEDTLRTILMSTPSKIYNEFILPKELYRDGEAQVPNSTVAIQLLFPGTTNFHVWPLCKFHSWILYNARHFDRYDFVEIMISQRMPPKLFGLTTDGSSLFNTPILLAIDLYINYREDGISLRILEAIFRRTPPEMFRDSFGMSGRSYGKLVSKISNFYAASQKDYRAIKESRGVSVYQLTKHRSIARILADGNLWVGPLKETDPRLSDVLNLLRKYTSGQFVIMNNKEVWQEEMTALRVLSRQDGNRVFARYLAKTKIRYVEV